MRAPVVNGLAQDGHVVCVQHAVHEANALPRRYQPRGALNHLGQQRRVLLVLPCSGGKGPASVPPGAGFTRVGSKDNLWHGWHHLMEANLANEQHGGQYGIRLGLQQLTAAI